MTTYSLLLFYGTHFLAALLWAVADTAFAEGDLFKVPTRPDVKTTPNAKVFLLPDGSCGFGKVEDGHASGGNFLIRSAPYFLDNGFNVAIFRRPNDSNLNCPQHC